MTTLWMRCSWFRLCCVTLNILRMAMKEAKHLVTSIIWHICGKFVNNVVIDWDVIVFNLLAPLSSSNYTLPFVSCHFGGTTFFWQNFADVFGMFCGVYKQTRHQTWLQLLMTSPLPILLLSFLWLALPSIDTNQQYISCKEITGYIR